MVSRYSEFIDFPIYLQVRTGRVGGGSDVCVLYELVCQSACVLVGGRVCMCVWGGGAGLVKSAVCMCVKVCVYLWVRSVIGCLVCE